MHTSSKYLIRWSPATWWAIQTRKEPTATGGDVVVSDNAFAAGSALGADAVVSFNWRKRHDVNYLSRASEPNQSLNPKFAY
ncbi:hypothetical protein CVS28_03210 [Arthrobacter glacialis]|nr:hypothetical protein CVS28_03210 [Arthrobacter glacialis]